MIRLSWRQFRAQTIVAVGALVAVAILFIVTRGHLDHIYGVVAACAANAQCSGANFRPNEIDRLLELVATVLVVVPALVGVFWGAPLIAREFENGTHRLAWTQSVTRTKWLAAKLAVVGACSVAVTGVLSLLVTWWSTWIDRANQDRFGSGIFGERNIVPLGYAAFGFALGALAGLLIRRTLPAMVATMVAFIAVRLTFTYAVRPQLFAPQHKAFALDAGPMGFGSTNGGPPTLIPIPPNVPNAWVYSTHIVDSAGHSLTGQLVASSCPALTLPPAAPPQAGGRLTIGVGGDIRSALQDCVTKLSTSYHDVVTLQPASRYWPLQWLETTIYVAAALALVGCCFWLLRRRAS
jgi:ABC-type transport system involved in multi-copper enzyme maturation permease subunit